MPSPHHQPDIRPGVTVLQDGDVITIKPQALKIIWGGDKRYWDVPEGSNAKGPTTLLNVTWLEVEGCLEYAKLKKNSEYNVIFRVSLKQNASGWSESPVYFMVSHSNEFVNWADIDLSTRSREIVFEVMSPQLRFKTLNDLTGEPLRFGMFEIWKGNWKSGLVIHEVVIKPAQ